ncbi:MAG: GntR family transcriptional regulator [Anaerostipes sp.]
MLVYDFADRKDKTLYEFLYSSLKRDILNGRLAQGSKLPSKRALAKDNQISVRTVMNAYEQLLAEGFIVSEEKEDILLRRFTEDDIRSIKRMKKAKEEKQKDYVVDFTAHKLVCDKFPVSMWKKIMRKY